MQYLLWEGVGIYKQTPIPHMLTETSPGSLLCQSLPQAAAWRAICGQWVYPAQIKDNCPLPAIAEHFLFCASEPLSVTLQEKEFKWEITSAGWDTGFYVKLAPFSAL